jgi:queuine tRNA-ribosyltransferase
VIEWIRPILPEHKTRYTMGVGLGPQDLIEVVANGIDIFDCVAPTRNARHGALYHGKFIHENNWLKFAGINGNDRLLIKKSIYAKDETPIMEDCTCSTCQQFTKAYLHFLFKQQGALYYQLACIHNVHVMQEACRLIRKMIKIDI